MRSNTIISRSRGRSEGDARDQSDRRKLVFRRRPDQRAPPDTRKPQRRAHWQASARRFSPGTAGWSCPRRDQAYLGVLVDDPDHAGGSAGPTGCSISRAEYTPGQLRRVAARICACTEAGRRLRCRRRRRSLGCVLSQARRRRRGDRAAEVDLGPADPHGSSSDQASAMPRCIGAGTLTAASARSARSVGPAGVGCAGLIGLPAGGGARPVADPGVAARSQKSRPKYAGYISRLCQGTGKLRVTPGREDLRLPTPATSTSDRGVPGSFRRRSRNLHSRKAPSGALALGADTGLGGPSPSRMTPAAISLLSTRSSLTALGATRSRMARRSARRRPRG